MPKSRNAFEAMRLAVDSLQPELELTFSDEGKQASKIVAKKPKPRVRRLRKKQGVWIEKSIPTGDRDNSH